MKKNRFSRREIVAAAGMLGVLWPSLSPAKQLLNAMVKGLVKDSRSKVLGNTLSAQPGRNLLQFNLYGAPSRWFFDHALRPGDSDPFVQEPGAYNKIEEIDFNNPHLSRGTYADFKVRGINMPYLWQYDVAKAGGGSRPMAELMNNMLAIRGCNLGADGHPLNCIRQVSPVPGDVSITGLAADASSALFPAINVGRTPANRAFKSSHNTSVIDVPSGHPDYISFLLENFNQSAKSGKTAVDADVETALAALQAYSLSNEPGAEVLYNERRRAEKLMRAGIKNLDQVFEPLVKKYKDLFQRSLNLSAITGATDKLIPGLKFPCEVPGDIELMAGLGSHHFDSHLICSADIRSMFAEVESQNMAQHFALAEFALTEGLSSSILLAPPMERGSTLLNLAPVKSYRQEQIEKKYDSKNNKSIFSLKAGAESTFNTFDLLHDSHLTGWMTNVIGCNLFYRGFSSCLLELIDRLKEVPVGGGSLFDETVIQFASEYERAPTHRGGGLTHNGGAGVTSFFSGIIQQPAILGNVYDRINLGTPFEQGTVGQAAPIAALQNKVIDISNISSTLSEMLRVPKIVPRAESLVEVKGAKLTPTIEPARNVKNEKI